MDDNQPLPTIPTEGARKKFIFIISIIVILLAGILVWGIILLMADHTPENSSNVEGDEEKSIQDMETMYQETRVIFPMKIQDEEAMIGVEKEKKEIEGSSQSQTPTSTSQWHSTFDETTTKKGRAYIDDSVVKLVETNESAYLFRDMVIPDGSNYMSLDFKFLPEKLGDGDYLTIHLNNDLVFWFKGTSFYGDEFWTTGLLNISSLDVAGKLTKITLGLNAVGMPNNSELWIDNLAFYKVEFSKESVE